MRQADSKKTLKAVFLLLLLLLGAMFDQILTEGTMERRRAGHEELRAMKRASDPIMIITPDEEL